VIVKQKKFGNNGPEVSVIGQGTWYLDRGDRKAAIAALHRGIETGMTHIDTAEMYGEAEPVIADAIAGLPREKLFLVSKVLPSNALAARHHHRLRAFAETAEDRSSRLLSPALARLVSIRGDGGGVRRTGSRGENPLLGRQQFRCRRSRRTARGRGRGQDRLQPGTLSSAGAGDRTRCHPVV
jgi:hypothetical protein